MTVRLLTEHNLELLCLLGDCTGSSESTHVKMPHCWKSCVEYLVAEFLTVNNQSTGREFAEDIVWFVGLYGKIIHMI